MKILKNLKNLGASASRNKGIEVASGEFLLFMDDDCVANRDLLLNYSKILEKYPNHPGYVGVTNMPDSHSNFEKAIRLSDMLHFFTLAEKKEEMYWGITANLFVRADSIGEIRFPIHYPKKGGGEDINFCLKIIENYNDNNHNNIKLFKSCPAAHVTHPFWSESCKSYIRFFRWGYGDVNLHRDFSQYRFHQYPNLIEYFTILLILILINLIFLPKSIFIVIIYLFINLVFFYLWELICEMSKFKSQRRNFNFISLVKAVLIRQLNDYGRYLHQMPKLWKFTERWDYFCTGESIKYERLNALKKFIGYFFISLFLLIILIF